MIIKTSRKRSTGFTDVQEYVYLPLGILYTTSLHLDFLHLKLRLKKNEANSFGDLNEVTISNDLYNLEHIFRQIIIIRNRNNIEGLKCSNPLYRVDILF